MNLRKETEKRLLKFLKLYTTQNLIHQLKKCPQQVRYLFLMDMIRKNTSPHATPFAVCNSSGKNHGNVWEIVNRAHYGNEHIAIDKFNIFDILKRFLRDILFILWFTLVIQVSIVS